MVRHHILSPDGYSVNVMVMVTMVTSMMGWHDDG